MVGVIVWHWETCDDICDGFIDMILIVGELITYKSHCTLKEVTFISIESNLFSQHTVEGRLEHWPHVE